MVYTENVFSISAVLQKSSSIIKKNIYPLLVSAIVFSLAIIIIFAVPRVFAGIASNLFISAPIAILMLLFAMAVLLSGCAFTLDLCTRGCANFKKLIPNPAHVINYLFFNILITVISIPLFILFFMFSVKLYLISYHGYVFLSVALSILYYYLFYFRMAFVPLAYTEGLSITEGITVSYELTRRSLGKFLFIFLLCLALITAGSLFFMIGISIAAPLALVIYSCAYLELTGSSEAQEEQEDPKIPEQPVKQNYYVEKQKVETPRARPQIEIQKMKPQMEIQTAAARPQPETQTSRVRPPVIEDKESYLGKGTDITDYSNVNSNMIDLKNREKKGR